MIEKFAGYGFNKSHSTAYALIAYMTAYLKAHYPVEFMAALLSGDIAGRNFKKKDSLVEHLEDCRRMNIEVLPPDVNRSRRRLHRRRRQDPVRTVGHQGLRRRGRGGHRGRARRRRPFRESVRFLRAGRSQPGEPRGHRNADQGRRLRFARRPSALAVHGRRRAGRASRRGRSTPTAAAAKRGCSTRSTTSRSRRATGRDLPDLPEWEEPRTAGRRKGSARLLSDQPSAGRARADARDLLLAQHARRGRPAAIAPRSCWAACLASIKLSQTKNPRPGSTNTKYAMFDLEDMRAALMRCILWPEDFAKFGHLVAADAILVVRGAVDRRPGSEEANLIVNELIPLADRCAPDLRKGIIVRVERRTARPARAGAIARDVARLPGLLRAAISALPGRWQPGLHEKRSDARRAECRTGGSASTACWDPATCGWWPLRRLRTGGNRSAGPSRPAGRASQDGFCRPFLGSLPRASRPDPWLPPVRHHCFTYFAQLRSRV